MKSIAYEWAYRYALLLRLDSPVLRDHDRGLPGRTPRTQGRCRDHSCYTWAAHLGDNGLGHGPDPSGPRSPFGARCGHHGRVWSQGHRRPPVGSAPPSCLHVDGSLWCSRQPLGYTRDTILGDLSQGLGLLLGEDLPRPIVRRGCVVKTMIFGCGTIQGVSLVISSAR